MKTLRPVEEKVIYQEEKKDRVNSWAAVPVSVEFSKLSTVKVQRVPGTEERKEILGYE